jgi:hypothetical protein
MERAGNPGSLEFEPVVLVEPTADQLQQYAGEYESEELSATYRFTGARPPGARQQPSLGADGRDGSRSVHPHVPAHENRNITFLRDQGA